MDRDDDISAALPGPPPPAPAPREAAIGAALARFDGSDARARIDRPRGATGSWWASVRRPQMGALVAAVLIVGISVPVAIEMASRPIDLARDPATPPPGEPVPPGAAAGKDSKAAAPTAATTLPQKAGRGTDRMAAEVRAPVEVAAAERRAEDRGAIAAKPAARPSPAAPPASPPTAASMADPREAEPGFLRDSADNGLIVAARSRSAATPAPAPVLGGSNEIIVTGSKIAAPKLAPRGDWNACTIDDPSRSLSRCTRLVGEGNRRTRDRAQSHLSDGLSYAWQGDNGAAVAAFDKAIQVSPRLSIAYLNRGLAYARGGDVDRAIDDLDQAVRFAPDAARAYYARSRLLRQSGDEDRARADEQRAIAIDPRYKAVVE